MRPTQLNQHTAKSDRNKDTHAHYTNLKQHTSHTRHADRVRGPPHECGPSPDTIKTACPRHDQAPRRIASEPQQGARPVRHADRAERSRPGQQVSRMETGLKPV